jgi:solute carrier family 7 (L-type amino acid transporter), member 9/15
LAFAELGAVVPRSGAEYAYFIEAFGKLHPFWGPLPSFVCAWVYVMVLRPAEVAVIILTFSQYVFQPFEESLIGEIDKDHRAVVLKLIALVALGTKKTHIPTAFCGHE